MVDKINNEMEKKKMLVNYLNERLRKHNEAIKNYKRMLEKVENIVDKNKFNENINIEKFKKGEIIQIAIDLGVLDELAESIFDEFI